MILPLVWSVPEALITAELATTFPENSGYVAWVTAAFGPFWGFQVPSHPHTVVSCTLIGYMAAQFGTHCIHSSLF